MSKPDTRTALVTGATGFIGRRLCERLQAEGWSVVAIARTEAPGPWNRFVSHEFGSGPLQLPVRPEVVFHLAGRTHTLTEKPSERDAYFQVNVSGMKELLAALGEDPAVRVIFTSSVKAYGEETGPEGVDEAAEARPTTPYGESKLEAERILLSSALGPRAVVLRLAMVFGYGQKGNLVEMIRSVAANRFPPIPDNGNRRSMVHVDDVVAGLVAAAKAPVEVSGGRTYYLSGRRAWSSRELFLEICRALGRPAPRWHVPAWALRIAGKVGDLLGWVRGRRFVWDSDKYEKLFGSACFHPGRAMKDLGYSPSHGLDDAMSAMVANVLERRIR